MEILVTGANGFLGKVIAKELENNNNLKSLSRTSGDYQCTLENEIPNFAKKFNVVIHAAGKAHSIPKSALEKKQFHDVNVLGTQNLLKGLEQVGLPDQFIYISSVSVYGLYFGKKINEEYPLQAKDSYGLSKIEAEKLVLQWCKQNDIVCTILRLPLLVGENPPGNLGVMLRAINKGYYFNIGGGKAQKSMVLAKDVAKLMPVVAPIGGIYNLTDGYHPNFDELSMAISIGKQKRKFFNMTLLFAKAMGLVGNILGEKALINSLKIKKITSDLTFDDSKARKLLNWNPEVVLEYLKRNKI